MNVSAGEMANRLDALASSATFETIKRDVGVGGVALVERGFATSTDPYGSTWEPLQRPRVGGPVLVRTGAMRGSVKAEAIPGGVRFSVNTPYARFHQYGTRSIHERKMLPSQALGLPEAWRLMVVRSFTGTVRHQLGVAA